MAGAKPSKEIDFAGVLLPLIPERLQVGYGDTPSTRPYYTPLLYTLLFLPCTPIFFLFHILSPPHSLLTPLGQAFASKGFEAASIRREYADHVRRRQQRAFDTVAFGRGNTLSFHTHTHTHTHTNTHIYIPTPPLI